MVKPLFWFIIVSINLTLAVPTLHARLLEDALALPSYSNSQYLREHQNDAVRWHVLTHGVLKKAQKNKKLIFISSGYQACYWCYRMKQDSFTNKKAAKHLNTSFVPVLIDREQDPALDLWLRTFLEQIRGIAGWPVNVVLTPSGHPLAATSWLSAEEFSNWLDKIDRQWQERSSELTEIAHNAAEELKAREDTASWQGETSTLYLLQIFLEQSSTAADETYGGFGQGQKFTHLPQLLALVRLQALNPNKSITSFLTHTIQNMLNGGLRDHINGGFFRYTDDRQWSRPHFEKMLYTQALMAKFLIESGLTLNQPQWILTGVSTLQFTIRKMKISESSYAASLSAFNQEGDEGGAYLWSKDGLRTTLGSNWENIIANHYGDDATMVLPKVTSKTKREHTQTLQAAKTNTSPLPDYSFHADWHGLLLSALSYGAPFADDLAKEADTLNQRLLDLDETDHEDLSDRIMVAHGLADWGSATGDEKSLIRAEELLALSLDDYDETRGWIETRKHPILGDTYSLVLRDGELPSLSTLWLESVNRLNHIGKSKKLAHKAKLISSRWNQDMKENSFFHAGLIAYLVGKQVEKQSEVKTQAP